MNQGSNDEQIRNGDCCSDLAQFWKGIPILNKFIIIVTSSITIINIFLNGYLAYYLINIPYYTVYNFQIWRLATCMFCPSNLIDLIFSLWMLYEIGILVEITIGTVHFFLEIFCKNILIQVMYTILMFLFSLFNTSYLLQPSNGLFNTIMMLLTLQCFLNPDAERQFCCFQIYFKNKYYCLIMFGLFCLLSGAILWDMLCAILLAYAEVKLFNKDLFKFSYGTIEKIENVTPFKQLKTRTNFVQKQSAQTGIQVQYPQQPQNFYANMSFQNHQVEEQPQQQPVMKGKHVKIGQSQPSTGIVSYSEVTRQPNPIQSETLSLARQAALKREEQFVETQKKLQTVQQNDSNNGQSV